MNAELIHSRNVLVHFTGIDDFILNKRTLAWKMDLIDFVALVID